MSPSLARPGRKSARVRQVDLICLQPKLAMLILVTLESNVRQVLLHLPEEVSRDVCRSTANRFRQNVLV